MRAKAGRNSPAGFLLSGGILPVLLLLAAGLGACGPTDVPPGWKAGLLEERAAKDEYMRSGRSPLDPADVPGFPGIAYYDPDPGWRFAVPPDRTDAGAPAELLDTAGQPRNYRVHSRVHLRLDGRKVVLTVYQTEDGAHLFLPFKDATNGEETYGAGRYLDPVVDREGRLVVDFNRAYNPYCAYASRWVCPVVPEENVLPVAVTAGEKAYH